MKLALALVLLALLITTLAQGSEESLKVVHADEIMSKISKGEPVVYDHIIVKGDLSLDGLGLPIKHVYRTEDEIKRQGLSEDITFISSPITITRSVIDGHIYLNDMIFDDIIDFSFSQFNSTADFSGSQFNGDYADFWGSQFKGTADYYSSQFNRYTFFKDSQFKGTADFSFSQFNSTADFRDSQFNGYTYFFYSHFNYAYFLNSQFNNIVYFNNTRFEKEARFEDAQFNGITSFNNARFKDDVLFEGAEFNCTLDLTRTKYDNLDIRWRNIKDLEYDDSAYLSLMKNFEKLGYLEDYDNCYYEYRGEHRGQEWSGKFHGMHWLEERARKDIDWLLWLFYGYGKRPLYPLIWSIVTVLLFGLIWVAGGINEKKIKRGIFEIYGHDQVSASNIQPSIRDWQKDLSTLAEAMIFSGTVFLSGTRLFIDPPNLPEVSGWSRSQVKIAFTAERVLGAFFSVLFFLSIGATVVR